MANKYYKVSKTLTDSELVSINLGYTVEDSKAYINEKMTDKRDCLYGEIIPAKDWGVPSDWTNKNNTVYTHIFMCNRTGCIMPLWALEGDFEDYTFDFDSKYEFKQILTTMLWAEVSEEGEPLDQDCDIEHISEDLVKHLRYHYKRFVKTALTILPPDFVPNWSNIAHDFWLTCKGHGAGFWDRKELEYQNLGQQLTKACEDIRLPEPYIGDDGKVYGM